MAASVTAHEDSPVSPKYVQHLGVEVGYDYVASSVGDDLREEILPADRISSHTSLPLSLKYSFSFNDPKVRNYLPGGYQGFSVGVLNIGAGGEGGLKRSTKYIGYPVSAYVFQGGPFHHFSDNLYLNYEWNFGAAIGWKPYSEYNKNYNLTVGSRVNAYLNLSLGLTWMVSPATSLSAGFAVSHFSNGNTSWPNPGVNSFGLRLGITHTFNPPRNGYAQIDAEEETPRRKGPEYDISIWGASRKRVYRGGEEPVLLPGHFACAGVSFAPMFRLGRWWRLGGSLDIQWDQSSDMKKNYISGSTTEDIKFTNPSFFRQMSWGVSAHGELQMPIFAVNIGLGYNLVAPWENRGFYQNITLKTYLGENLFLNVGYQLRNFYQQSSLMLGLGVTI